MNRYVLALDIGSNSVGSSWFDLKTGDITTGTSVFPAGVDETDDKRGDPKNAKRRMTRRTRITLRRRAQRKRELRLRLIAARLLPETEAEFRALLERTDPWTLRRDGLDKPLTPHQFGRVLLHLAQRRGAMGLAITIEENEEGEVEATDDGAVKKAIGEMRIKMRDAKVRTFGEFVAKVRAERVHKLPGGDPRPSADRKGPREYRDAIRNKAGNYEHCADRAMIRDEFRLLWEAQRKFTGETAELLTDALRIDLDNDQGDSIWRHKGLLFGQRRQSWDLGTLGRCVLEPTERCAPHADMHASRYRVVETINNLRIVEWGKPSRPLTSEERQKIKAYLSGPLGMLSETKRKDKKTGKTSVIPERPKQSVTMDDLRGKMAEWYGKENWPGGNKKKLSPFHFNIEADEDREINTDWFSREIVHGAIGAEAWARMPESIREGINHAILNHNPEEDGDEERLRNGKNGQGGLGRWAGLSKAQIDALTAAWKRRPKPDAKRLNMSRRAVRNLLTVMDLAAPWPDPRNGGSHRWLTQIEARKVIAEDADFRDATTGRTFEEDASNELAQSLKIQGKPFDASAEQAARRAAAIRRRRYATGAKGATAKDRHYMGKHVLMQNGKAVVGPDGRPLVEPPPAPLISNPVVRKAIHEVRRHVVEYLTTFGRKPDAIHIELAREARMGAKDADRLLFKNRLRNRIRSDIVECFKLQGKSPTQQRAAVDRVVLCAQQGGASGICPLCGKGGLTPRKAAEGDGCEVAHIIPRGSGGHNGLGNIVLAHTKCNRDMGRRTPREFWTATLKGGFEEGFRWLEGIFAVISRPKPAEIKKAEGDALWACYFDFREDKRKIEQFAKNVKDIQEMTNRQEAATKYAARQVMAYLSDALFDGKGLPERSSGGGDPENDRRVFATDGMWTARLRREWGLFFDPHHARAKDLSTQEEHLRKEKNRGDHRHHAIDAVVIGLCTRSVQIAWEQRERAAADVKNSDGTPKWNVADEEQMERYRRDHPLPPPAPYKTREEFREAVRAAVFGDEKTSRPICHRPVKRKLVGALHEETLLGPALDRDGQLTNNFTAKKNILSLTPNHLRMPEGWDELEAKLHDGRVSLARKAEVRRQLSAMDDPSPAKSGIVRDRSLRNQIRACLRAAGLDPDGFSTNEIKKLVETRGIRQASGVPIRSVVLLRTMNEPVLIDRKRPDYSTGSMVPDGDAASLRAYVGGNNHHVEIRAARNIQGNEVLTAQVISAFEAGRRKLAKLRAFRAAKIPKPDAVRSLPSAERANYRPIVAAIEKDHAIVNRADDVALGGRFVMSLCEGEMVFMLHKVTRQPGHFVVAKLDKIGSSVGIVLVPHWDARAAGERKDPEGRTVPDSARDQFSATPHDLASLAPPGHPHAMKVRVSPLGVVTFLHKD